MDYTGLKLNMNVFYDELVSLNPEIKLFSSPDFHSSQLRMFPSEDMVLSKDYLYIANYSDIISLDENSRILNFICPEKAENAESSGNNIIYLDGTISCSALFFKLQDIFHKYTLWYQRMVEIILNNGSYKELLDAGAQMLRNPVALFDPSLELITYAGQLPEEYDGTIWEQVINLGYTPLENYTDEHKKKIFKELNLKKEPYFQKENESDKYTELVANIFMDNKRIGNLGAIDINAPFSSGQQYIMNHIKRMIETYILNHNDSLFLSTDYDSLVQKMIKGYYVDEKVARRHLQKLNWKDDCTYYLFVFENLVHDFSDAGLYKTYKYRIERFFKKCITTLYDNNLITIVPKEQFSIDQSDKVDTFKDFLKGTSLRAGVSLNFSRFIDLKYHFNQAASALRYGTDRMNEESVSEYCFFYQDFFLEDLVDSIGKKNSLQSLCHSKIISLKEYDEESGSEYVKTLYHYLLCGRNLTDASEQLFIHRNTLNYRISRIREIIDVDIDDYNQAFYLMTSCRLVIFL